MGTFSVGNSREATAFSNGRRRDRTSNGVQWTAVTTRDSGGNYGVALLVSTDNGTTESLAGSVDLVSGGTSYHPTPSFFIDPANADDIAYLTFKSPGNGFLYLRRGTPNAARATYTWSDATLVLGNASDYHPDMVVFRDLTAPGASVAHVVSWRNSTGAVWHSQINVASNGTLGTSSSRVIGIAGTSISAFPVIDFNHTGDAKTIKASQPDLYIAWSAGQSGAGYGIRFIKGTHSSGSWAWGTEREIDSTRYIRQNAYWLSASFDGTRIIFGGYIADANGNEALVLHERDSADTTTTPRVLVSSPSGSSSIFTGAYGYDTVGNVHFVGSDGNNPANLYTRKWTRSTASLDAPVLVDNSTQTSPWVSTRRGPAGGAVDYVYTDGTASPFTVTSGRIALNTAPTAATPTTPTAGSGVDRTQPITLAWVFNDPDAGDSQSKADIRYKLTSASTWTTILGATTTATSYALPANQTAGDYEWQVLTYDALGVASPWSASSFFTAANPPGTPVITAPANGGTVATASYLTSWSSPQQDAYEVRRVADSGGSPAPGAVYFTTGTVEDSSSRARTLAFETNNRTEHVQVRVRYSGIWSQWATARVLVSYTPPATPVVVLTPQDASGSMLVTITNPTPSGNQPTVASHDVLIDDGFGEGFTRRVTGWAPGATYTYWLPVSSRDYVGNIKVVAVATNSTTSTGVAT